MHLPKFIIRQIIQDIQQELEDEEEELQLGSEDDKESVELMEYLASIEEYSNQIIPTPVPSPVPDGECWIPDPNDSSDMLNYVSVFPGDKDYPNWGQDEGLCYMHIDLYLCTVTETIS